MKKTKLFILLALTVLCLATVALAAACGASATLKLDKETVQLYVNGDTQTVRATLDPQDKTAQYEWTIDNKSVATISATQSVCRITPVAEGSATITVTVGKASASCTVNVGADQHKKLNAPSFTYDADTNIITVNDTVNSAAEVGGYELYFYAEGEPEAVGSVAVESGKEVDTRRIDKGTYTVRLVALGSSDLFYSSEPSEATAQITVSTDPLYDLGAGDAACKDPEGNLIPGRWAYYVYDWVTCSEAYWYDGEVTFTFENNTSDNIKEYSWITQLIFSHGKTDSSKTYKMNLKINVPVDCRISLGGKLVSLHAGDNLVTVGFKPDKDPQRICSKFSLRFRASPSRLKRAPLRFP